MLFLYRLYLIQPFGYRRDEFNTGLIASTILNSQRATASSKSFSPQDLMPYSHRRTHESVDAMNLRILKQAARRQCRQ